ncbi:hypothetical protein [Plantibacter sp. YIM 135347]|uniref:hypothetical protein n=1 Tax=Plantibacter sp. YIM 135347 TaxID=3423919 RepID=UPI003D3346E3
MVDSNQEPSAVTPAPPVEESPTPPAIHGSWSVDVERERRAMVDFVWGLRPSILRWPFLIVVCALAAVVTALVLTTGLAVGWVLAGVLAALLLLVVVIRVVLMHSLRTSLTPAVPHGASVEVTLDASGWHSRSSDQSHTCAWDDYDRATVEDGYLIVTAAWKGRWLPRSLVYAPLSAFGSDGAFLPDVIASVLPGSPRVTLA